MSSSLIRQQIVGVEAQIVACNAEIKSMEKIIQDKQDSLTEYLQKQESFWTKMSSLKKRAGNVEESHPVSKAAKQYANKGNMDFWGTVYTTKQQQSLDIETEMREEVRQDESRLQELYTHLANINATLTSLQAQLATAIAQEEAAAQAAQSAAKTSVGRRK